MWVGGVADSQTRSKPLKTPQITPKIAFFDPNFTFRFPKSHKNPGVDGWVNRFGRDLPKKGFLFVGGSSNDKEWLWIIIYDEWWPHLHSRLPPSHPIAGLVLKRDSEGIVVILISVSRVYFSRQPGQWSPPRRRSCCRWWGDPGT